MKLSSQRRFQIKSPKRLSRRRVQIGGFALGLAVAIAASLITWHSVEPAFASYNYSSSEPNFESINVFGDSLVDSGNLFSLTSAFSAEGVPALPPTPPYAQKFSNGPVWIENVAQDLGFL